MWWLMSLISCVTANLWGNPLPLRSYRWTIMECTPTQEWAGQTDLETVFTRSGPRRRLKQTRGNASVYYGVEADGRISTQQPAGGRYLAPSVPARCPPAPSATRRSRWGSPPTGCYSAAPPRFSAAAPPGATGQCSWASSETYLQLVPESRVGASAVYLTHDRQLQRQVLHLHKVIFIWLLAGASRAHFLQGRRQSSDYLFFIHVVQNYLEDTILNLFLWLNCCYANSYINLSYGCVSGSSVNSPEMSFLTSRAYFIFF